LIAKDPDACNSLVTFQTRVVEEGFNMTKLSCNIARPKPGPQGKGLGTLYQRVTKQFALNEDKFQSSL